MKLELTRTHIISIILVVAIVIIAGYMIWLKYYGQKPPMPPIPPKPAQAMYRF